MTLAIRKIDWLEYKHFFAREQTKNGGRSRNVPLSAKPASAAGISLQSEGALSGRHSQMNVQNKRRKTVTAFARA
jgi:hypothetical protein